MGSHSVTRQRWKSSLYPQPKQVLDLANSDPGGMQGWVDLYYVKPDRLETEPATCQWQVQRPTAAPPRNTKAWAVCLRQRGQCPEQYTNPGTSSCSLPLARSGNWFDQYRRILPKRGPAANAVDLYSTNQIWIQFTTPNPT